MSLFLFFKLKHLNWKLNVCTQYIKSEEKNISISLQLSLTAIIYIKLSLLFTVYLQHNFCSPLQWGTYILPPVAYILPSMTKLIIELCVNEWILSKTTALFNCIVYFASSWCSWWVRGLRCLSVDGVWRE